MAQMASKPIVAVDEERLGVTVEELLRALNTASFRLSLIAISDRYTDVERAEAWQDRGQIRKLARALEPVEGGD
jgi:hypothetical protein